jgi:PIN domain nuclease of toxin-antitoxin system
VSRILLDTHAALFWWAGAVKLSDAARDAISRDDAIVFISAASGWEVSTKFRNRKLTFAGDPEIHMPRLMIEHDFQPLGVTMGHMLRAGALPGDHRDPFDRLIAAQALAEDMTVITRDREIAAFGCKVLW